MTPKQMGRLGLFHIEEAVLEVLLEEPEGLMPAEISKRIGIRGYPDSDLSLTYAIVHGVLIQLKIKELVEKLETGHWKLTEQ